MKIKIANIVIGITVILFLSNFIIVNAASSDKDEDISEIMSGMQLENYNSILEDGTTGTNGETKQTGVSVSGMQSQEGSMPFILKFLCRFILLIPQVVNSVLSQIASQGKEAFTIESLLTNEYDLFNIKFIIDPNGIDKNAENIIGNLGQSTAEWFVGIRNISLVGSVIVLIYVGIKLAIATVAKDKSELKKILLSWVEALVILLTLQIGIVFLVYLSDFAVETLTKTVEKTTGNADEIEKTIMTNINKNLDRAYQTQTWIFYTVLYIMFVYYEAKFFLLYIGRVLRISFYTIISPLVCVTYPIDKIGDGKAQGFNNWIIEFVVTVFMQPLQLLIYLIMVYSMGEIIARNPLLGILFLGSLSHVEKTLKSVLKIKPKLQKGLEDIKLQEFVG